MRPSIVSFQWREGDSLPNLPNVPLDDVGGRQPYIIPPPPDWLLFFQRTQRDKLVASLSRMSPPKRRL